MAYIKKITFERVGRNEGCVCDRCGQYIRNIYIVHYTDGVVMRYGIDCFSILCKSGRLNKHGMDLMKKAIKSIEYYSDELKKWENGEYTAENCLDWQHDQNYKLSAWYGVSFDEYKRWMIDEWFPARFADAQKQIDRFSKINFNR